MDSLNNGLRVAIKFFVFALLAVVLLVGLYFLAAFVLSRMSVAKVGETVQEIPIYLLSNGVHTDLVVPVQSDVIDWNEFISIRHTKDPDFKAKYVAFGWGDKGFYLETPTWADLKVSTAFKAMFGLSSSAIHATFYESLQEDQNCKKIWLSRNQYQQLVAFIKKRFQITAAGLPIHIETNANYGLHDAFYEAVGSYNLFYTCNTWTNNGLKAAGQKACLWTPTDSGILYQYS
ncbi:MAG: TIGR02117 family protein [Rufibacter sp.]